MWVEHHIHTKASTVQDPDRWCSYTACGQELWQIACQWVWNLRLCLGQTMQGVQVREIEWAPPKEAPPVFIVEETPPEEYGPWQWAAAFGRATGRFGAKGFVLQEDGKLRWEAGGQPVVERSASRECLDESGPSIWPTRPIVCPVPSARSVSRQGPKGIALAESAPLATSCPRLRLLNASLSFSDRCDGWMWQGARFVADGWPDFRRQ
jgi:hypothetical protein